MRTTVQDIKRGGESEPPGGRNTEAGPKNFSGLQEVKKAHAGSVSAHF